MDLTQLHPEVLRSLLKLSEQKSALLNEIKAIDSKISSLAAGGGLPKEGGNGRRGRKPGRKPGRKAKVGRPAKAAAGPKPPKAAKGARGVRTGKRGALKSRIIGLLESAGPSGIAVKEIASKLNVKPQNVHVWFSSTGKKMKDIVKVGEARYAINSAPVQHQQPEPANTEAAPAAF